MVRRRDLLGSVAVAAVSAGCIWGPSLGPGDLRIENESGSPVDLTVRLEKHSGSAAEDRRRQTAPPPQEPPLWERSDEYSIPDGEVVTVDEFVEEQGVYFVEVLVEDGDSSGTWVNYESNPDSSGGTYISVFVQPNGGVAISFPYND